MKLLSRIFSGPAIKQLRQLVAESNAIREKLAQFSAKPAEADKLLSDARDRFFRSLRAEDFDQWIAAQARHAAVVICVAEIGRRGSWQVAAELETPAARELLLAALRDSAESLGKEVDALAAAEKQRLGDSGIDAVTENPALTKLRDRVAKLREAHDDLNGRENFGHHVGNYLSLLEIK